MRTFALLLVLAACASEAEAQTAAAPSPREAYVAVLSSYPSRAAQAVRALSQWRTSDVERALGELPRTTVGSVVVTGGDGAKRLLERMALLHAETALAHYERDDTARMRAHPLHAARLRLGRVLLELGREAEALVELERTLTEDEDAANRYLANLFLASLHERNGRVSDAAFHFKAAAALFRSAQAPYLGLSHLQLQRDPANAADTLQGMFDRRVEATSGVPDPWWLYDAGFGASFAARLEKRRAAVSMP